MDIDLAGRTNNQLDHIKEIVGAVCDIAVDPDGNEFDRTSIDVSRIKEDADYEGVRVRFHGTLARARIPMQLDIGFSISLLQDRPRSSTQRCSISPRPFFRPIQNGLLSLKNWKRSLRWEFSIAESKITTLSPCCPVSIPSRADASQRQSARLSDTEVQQSKPNRLGLRKRTAMIPHELSNGVPSCAGAGSEKRRET
jgi:hypothetical protein